MEEIENNKIWIKNGKIFENPLNYFGKYIINPTDNQLIKAGYQLVDPDSLLTLKDYEDAVQKHLDTTAQSRGYDNTYTCLSYLESTNPTWKTEAEIFNTWRDSVWTTCHQILNQWQAGEINQPTIQEVLNQLPVITW